MNLEIPKVIHCGADRLLGVLHAGSDTETIGVLIVVGGPQYRVGSHRQFVKMARRIAAAGFHVLRFDYRGMGDSEGEQRSFLNVNQDIEAASELFRSEVSNLSKVVILGLCDAASAALMYTCMGAGIDGLILINPWVRTEMGEARTFLRYYYVKRILQKSFWKKVFSGNWKMAQSVSSLGGSVRNAVPASKSDNDLTDPQFLNQMLKGFSDFQGQILLLISGRDLTAQEFVDLCRTDRNWKKASRRRSVTLTEFPNADHTLSTRTDLYAVCDACISWFRKIE